MIQNRRTFLTALAGLTAVGRLAEANAQTVYPSASPLPISCNQYTWYTFYERRGLNWHEDLDASLKEFAQSGIVGYEPGVKEADEIKRLGPLLKKHRLEMPSIYVNSLLHQEAEADQSIRHILTVADAARPLGVKIIVTNPNTLSPGGPADKEDVQLEIQAKNLNRLGTELKKRGITLAYHNHDAEMRQSAREFHHMMLGTDPQVVSLCLDVHWVYRGAGNSQVALFDVVRLYGKRIVELHLRQSKNGIWTEVFSEGDIDYSRLVRELQKAGIRPHLVLEQCVEKQTPHTVEALEAHRQDLQYATRLFASLVR